MSHGKNVTAEERGKIEQILSKSLDPSVHKDIKTKDGSKQLNIKVSTTRSGAILIDNLIWKKNSIFIKITPHLFKNNKGMADSEIKLYNVTSLAMDRGLSKHFVKCYNKELVKSNHVEGVNITFMIDVNRNGNLTAIPANSYTVLIIENLGEHSMPFEKPLKMQRDLQKELKELQSSRQTDEIKNAIRETERRINKNKGTFKVLMLQIIHTLYVLHLLGIKHLDLHYGNIVLVPSGKERSYNKYTISTSREEVQQGVLSSKEMYLPNVHFDIKIIDYDGAVKMRRNGIIDPAYPKEFFAEIKNPGLKNMGFQGIENSYLQNFFKLLAHPLISTHFMEEYKNLSQSRAFTTNRRILFNKNSDPSRLNPVQKKNIKELYYIYSYLIRSNGKDITNKNLLMSPMDFLLKVVETEYNEKPSDGTIVNASNAVYFSSSRNSIRQSGSSRSVSERFPNFNSNEFRNFIRRGKMPRSGPSRRNEMNEMNINSNRRNNRNNLGQRMRNRLRLG